MKEAKGAYGVVRPGSMRGNLARHAPEKGVRVVGFTRESPIRASSGPVVCPQSVSSYIPAGPAVDEVLDDLAEGLDKDVLGEGFLSGLRSGWRVVASGRADGFG